MTEEDEAFKELQERINYREAFPKRKYVQFVDRNEVLEEVAKEFDKMPFGDTAASFAVFVRNMKT